MPTMLNKIEHTNVDRSLIKRDEITYGNWNSYKDAPPKVNGYYRVLLYDIDPKLYKLRILYYYSGVWQSDYLGDTIIRVPCPFWQALETSNV